MLAKTMVEPKELQRLGRLLNHATMLEAADLASEKWWHTEVSTALKGKWPANLHEQRKNLVADMRELLRALHEKPELVDTEWFSRRAHRALCQNDGIIGPGEDFIRQYRVRTGGGWGSWRLLTGDSLKREDTAAHLEIRFAPAGKSFEHWKRPDLG